MASSSFADLDYMTPDVAPCGHTSARPISKGRARRRRPHIRWRTLVIATSLLGLLVATTAASDPGEREPAASTRLSQSRVLPYPIEQVWPTAIRYLRVDRDYAIVDRDSDAGFILFDFAVGERSGRGSVEIFATEDASGRPSAQIKVSTDSGPVHLPHAILDGLSDKLRAERGQPAPPPPQPAPDPDPDPAP